VLEASNGGTLSIISGFAFAGGHAWAIPGTGLRINPGSHTSAQHGGCRKVHRLAAVQCLRYQKLMSRWMLTRGSWLPGARVGATGFRATAFG